MTDMPFPPLNPFPAQATTSIEEGPFLESFPAWLAPPRASASTAFSG